MVMDSRTVRSYERVRPEDIEPDKLVESTRITSQPQNLIPRKPLRSTVNTVEVAENNQIHESNKESAVVNVDMPRRHIYWVTPFTAIVLWLVGLTAAVCHSVFLYNLEGKQIGSQTWTFRYSLAIAFVFKSALVASISLALAQYAWFTLRKSKNGTRISAIDAIFLSESSLLSLLSPSLWRSATVTGLIALCAWLMPLTALVSPTALTIGVSTFNETEGYCEVPTLDWGRTQDFTKTTARRALFVSDYTDQVIGPSITSQRLNAAVLNTGHQLSWPSPCGQNCTYDIDFLGPSWQCMINTNNDDPRAPWKAQLGGSYWYWGQYGDGSNITVNSTNANNLLYSPIYYGGLNASTNQIWTAYASGADQSLLTSQSMYGSSLRDVLGVQTYSCQIANASYSMQVSYNNGIQQNTVKKVNPISTVDIASAAWEGKGSYNRANDSYRQNVPIPVQDLVGMYLPLVNMLGGYINRDPRSTLVSNTSLGQIPSLIRDLTINVAFNAETPYLPRPGLGPLLEELSQNLTISLMSIPSLFVTSTADVTCRAMHTSIVWRVDWKPIAIAYSVGLGMSLICLVLGARALVANRGAYDTAFSSILRTTRDERFNRLINVSDVGTLPMPSAMAKQRLEFIDMTLPVPTYGDEPRERKGFRLRD